ncbi:unnamed protein product [Schistocephalus solidus]|uniref:rRNA methyltransferase 1, mitochondrial n=1 Tax=Schistocephalus solidus TaxID=70667 RepID=A0A183TKJ4_SCHSO|nr:unnamed protein product [Schistocephalus solidus]
MEADLSKDLKLELSNLRKRCQSKSEVLYGIQPILGALKVNQRTFTKLYVKESFLQTPITELASKNVWLAEVINLASQKCLSIMGVPLEFLTAATNGRLNQGVVVECSPMPTAALPSEPLPQILHFLHCSFPRPTSFSCCGSSGIILLLDQLQDVMNLGSIFRSAVFFGIPSVLISAQASAMPSPLISKLSAGAMESLRFYRVPHIGQSLKTLSQKGFLVVGTAGKSQDPFKEDFRHRPALDLELVRPRLVGAPAGGSRDPPRPLILALGSETKGLSPEVLSACNLIVRIPGVVDEASACTGFVNSSTSPLPTSLNVAVATGILLYTLKIMRRSPTDELAS